MAASAGGCVAGGCVAGGCVRRWLRPGRRQAAGELAADLDPAVLLLFLQAMTVSGSLLAGEAKRLTGLDPHSAEFRGRVAAQLGEIVQRLA